MDRSAGEGFLANLRVRVTPVCQMLSGSKLILIWSSVALLFVCAILLRFVFTIPYHVSSAGMYPSHPKDEQIWANRLAYLKPVQVRRGDIITYRVTVQGIKQVYLKRVIGLPGDHVKIVLGRIYLEGSLLPQQFIRDEGDFKIYTEQIEERNYQIAMQVGAKYIFQDIDVVVPPGSFFVLGDNRYNSLDSRYTGFVQWDDIVARIW